MVAAGAERDEIVIRIVGMMKTLRSVGSQIACKHVGHCASHGLEHGPDAGAAATAALADAIRQLVQS
jgi:DNA-binding FrmR family transcriptional regulator